MNTSFESGRSRKGLSLLLALCLVLSLIVPAVSAASRDFTGAVTNSDGSVLEARLPVLAAGAGSAEYVPANGDCVLQLRVGADGKVPVYYTNGLLVGIPVGTKVSDGLLKAPEGKTLSYSPDNGVLSTGTVVTVLPSGESYTLVTYGDINGDSVLDALDATMIQRYVHHHRTGASAAQLEAALIDDDDETEVMDFSMFVNLSVSNEEFLKNQKKPLALCTASTPADGVATGSAYRPAMTVSEDGVALSAGDYTLSYSGNTAAGTGTVTATAAESSEYVGELSKSFTIYSLDGVGYPDTLLANTGAAQTAALTGLTGGLASFVPVCTYNGSATAPSAAGVYRVSATFTNSDGTSVSKTYGSMIIAPAATADYAVTVDNASKTMTVGVKNAYTADSGFASAIGTWPTTAESASVGGTAVTASTIVSKLQARTSYMQIYEETSNVIKTQNLSNVLGCLLPADNTLWTDNLSATTKTVTVNGVNVTVKLMQDAETLRLTKEAAFLYQEGAGRGQRRLNVSNSDTAVFVYGKQAAKTYEVRAAVITGKESSSIVDALSGTGLKGVLLGLKDMYQARMTNKTDSSGMPTSYGSAINLYDSNGKRYGAYSGTSEMISLITPLNSILTGMGMKKITTVFGIPIPPSLTDYIGSSGYIDYRNIGFKNGLRYDLVEKVSFAKQTASEDAHYTLTIGSATNGQFAAYGHAGSGAANLAFAAIPATDLAFMAKNEVIRVVATPASGYVLDKIQIVNASGTVLTTADANGDILMPASNGTLQVTFKPAN